jgi:hypothetical protein
MLLSIEQSTENYTVRAGDLALSFSRQGHHWSHALSVGMEAEWKQLLQSLEWTPPADRAPSPVFQDLRCERISLEIVEFQALGQCGHVTYSGAVRFDAAQGSIAFDCCQSVPRGRDMPLATASYQLAPDVATRQLHNGALQLGVAANGACQPLLLLTSADQWQRVGLLSAGRCSAVQLVNAGSAAALQGASSSRLQARLRYTISRA